MTPRRRRPLRWAKRLIVGLTGVLLLLCAPVGYVELACRGDVEPQVYEPLITDADQHRVEANSYLTYPEWHIVYAYDGLAQALRAGDEHAFEFGPSIWRFWTATCALMRVADTHGGADVATRSMIHTIGVSFTVEMAIKGLYEETIGRTTAWLRGPRKTPQDLVVADIATEYGAFLRQTPWYRYPFRRAAARLWAAPVHDVPRGWERRIGIGLEFQTKAAYAVLIGQAAAADPAPLTIRSVVSGLSAAELAGIPDVIVVRTRDSGVEIESPRYDRFTNILAEIARRKGIVREIAGNDEVMVTLTRPLGSNMVIRSGTVIMSMKRDGVASERVLLNVPVRDLTALLNAHTLGDPGVEHVFDY